MDYIRLVDISNTYPTLPSYVRQNDTSVNLFGLYKETNKLEFPLPIIEHITPIDDLKLRTIIGFRRNEQDVNIKYYTSQNFYSDMQAANVEGNPYFLTQAIKPEFIVIVNIERFISTFSNLVETENRQGVNIEMNNFILRNANSSTSGISGTSAISGTSGTSGVNVYNLTIDYTSLMKYLDWLLSPSELDDIDTDGVIPAEKLAKWEVGDYDPIMMKWSFNSTKNQTAGNTPPVDSGTSGTSGDSRDRLRRFIESRNSGGNSGGGGGSSDEANNRNNGPTGRAENFR